MFPAFKTALSTPEVVTVRGPCCSNPCVIKSTNRDMPTAAAIMPYARISDLPDSVRRHLPEHAQEIYAAAFNSAWEQYAGRADREVVAHKVAWAAVKQAYEKRAGSWVRKSP